MIQTRIHHAAVSESIEHRTCSWKLALLSHKLLHFDYSNSDEENYNGQPSVKWNYMGVLLFLLLHRESENVVESDDMKKEDLLISMTENHIEIKKPAYNLMKYKLLIHGFYLKPSLDIANGQN